MKVFPSAENPFKAEVGMEARSLWLAQGALAAVAVLAGMIPACGAEAGVAAEGQVHPCTGAGTWYPDDADRLRKLVEAYESAETVELPGPPVALVVPHAGYHYSGQVAGKTFATLKGRTYRRVLLFGPSHRAPVRGASVLEVVAYDTPLGRVPVDAAARDGLLACPVVTPQPGAHAGEHSVENQLPMLQVALGEFKMVEVLVGNLSTSERATLADVVRGLMDKGTLLVVSTDFCHYGPSYGYTPFVDRIPERLAALNAQAMREILEVDAPGWDRFLSETEDTVCGRRAVGLMLKVLEPWEDVRGVRVSYDTSGNILGNYRNSVTYGGVAFWRAAEGLTAGEQATLLRVAREAVEHFLDTGRALYPDVRKYELTALLKAPGAAFVTLKKDGRLRGCIGHVIATEPLYRSVAENATNACQDPRFTSNPVTKGEAAALEIEISVLSPMRRLHEPEKVRVGTDGLMISRAGRRGLLLPQVPTEQGWSRQEFLEGLCRKAGLWPDAWKEPTTELYRFSAQVFGEKRERAKEP